jgi:VIT1/CCC1 family predicted Fe2+/Mn2+ transporter
MSDSAPPPTPRVSTDGVTYEPHVGTTRQYWRDIVLGVNDGLVSMFLLVAGVVGGGLTAEQVLLTAVAGAIAGSISMAAGEYLATKSQEEVLDSEIALERVHIEHFRAQEVDQLRGFFRDMGVADDDMAGVVAAFSRSDETLLNAMKSLQFGVADSERRSPYMAMVMSGTLFLVGSLPSVLPFVITDDTGVGLAWAAALSMLGLFVVGVVKTRVTRTPPIKAGLENLVIAGIGGFLAYGIGSVFDSVISS